jgi:hypothetical protein
MSREIFKNSMKGWSFDVQAILVWIQKPRKSSQKGAADLQDVRQK